MMKLWITSLLILCGALAAVADEPRQVEVVAERANVMSGRDVVGTVSKGTQATLLSEQSTWYQIEFEANGQKRKGWIRQADVKLVEAAAAAVAAVPVTKPVEWLRITAERVDIKAGSATVGQLARNRVLQIVDTNGRWHKISFDDGGDAPVVGYVYDTQFEKLSPRAIGPSLDGFIPHSISPATASIDWSTGEVTLAASVPLAEGAVVRLQPGAPDLDVLDVPLQIAAGSLTLRVTGAVWAGLTRAGTRSLWFAEGEPDRERWHRVDLAPVELGTAVTARRFNNFDEGLLISLPAAGLLPGYLVEHAYQTNDGRTSRVQVLSSTKGTSPRVADVQKGTGDWPHVVRVVVPFATQPTEPLSHLFVIRQPDGSQSRTLKVQRRGDEIVSAATELAAALPLPVDVTVEVPSVELATTTQAAATIAAAGLQPLLVNQQSLVPLELKSVPDALVLRQGVAAGERLLVGAPLMLGVRLDEGLTWIDSSSVGLGGSEEKTSALEPSSEPPSELAPGTTETVPGTTPDTVAEGGLVAGGGLTEGETLPAETLAANAHTVDTGEELKFIDVNQTGLVGGSGGLQDTVGSTSGTSTSPGITTSGTTNATTSSGTGFVTGGLITDSDLGVVTTPLENSTSPIDVMDDPSSNLLVPVNPDPGILLDPTVDAETALVSGILKIIIDAILHQPDPSKLPGPIGQAITEALNSQEGALGQAPNEQAEREVVSAILTILLDKLRLSLTDEQRQQALVSWLDRRQHQVLPVLDLNGNGVGSDDVVISLVAWLHRQGLYNPASNVVIAQDSLGNSVATMSSTPVSLDWLKDLVPIVKPGQSSPPVIVPPSSPGASQPQPVDPLAAVPEGKALVSLGDGPDEVKVPVVNEKLVSEVKPALDDLGLRVSNLSELFATDRVVEANPEQGEWVKSDAQVELQILRRVPDLLKLTLTAAEAELQRHKLKASTVGKTFPEDIVIEQMPEPGTYTTADEPVKLALAIVAPVVEGLLLPEARDALTKRDLKWVFRTRSFDVDRVFQQTPPAGALVGHGDGIELTLQLPVPDVRGMTLAKARDVAKQWDLNLTTSNRLVRDSDTVRGQKPAPKEYVLHESDLLLGPVVTKVPDLVRQSVGQAEAKLKAEDLVAQRVGELVPSDKVTLQTPAAGTEIERGQPIKLDARLKLPDVVGTGIVDARDALQNLGIELRVTVDGAIGRTDLVYSQTPKGETLVYPRTEVVLVPGVNVPDFSGLTTEQANAELQRVGLKGTLVRGGEIETTDRRLEGQQLVGSQKPQPGLYKRSDLDVVRLTVNTYVLAVRIVPDVVSGEQVGPAVAAVRRADLNPVIVFRNQTYTPEAWTAFIVLQQIANAVNGDNDPIIVEVVNQAPEAGTRVIAGTSVRIVVESDGIGGVSR